MKKTILLTLISLFALAGCRGGDGTSSGKASTPPSSVSINRELTLDITNETKLDLNPTGKNFMTDGIGEATLVRVIDGDTAHFRVQGASEIVKIRFGGTDTPESTYRLDPWGKAAFRQMFEWLDGATGIILESDTGAAPVPDNTGERYLGYVWATTGSKTDLSSYFMTNLGMIELAYTSAKSTNDKYNATFIAASHKAQLTGRRIYGELDPEFDYTNSYAPVSIAEIINDQRKPTDEQVLVGRNRTVSGFITGKVGPNFYIQDTLSYDLAPSDEGYNPEIAAMDGQTHAIYIYAGFTMTSYLKRGMRVSVRGTWTHSDQFGYQFVIGANTNHTWLQFYGGNDPKIYPMYPIESEDGTVVNAGNYGMPVLLNNLEVVGFTPDTTLGAGDPLSVAVKDPSGHMLSLRVDGLINETSVVIKQSDFGPVGQKLSVLGVVGYYTYESTNGGYQLMVCEKADITLLNQ